MFGINTNIEVFNTWIDYIHYIILALRLELEIAYPDIRGLIDYLRL